MREERSDVVACRRTADTSRARDTATIETPIDADIVGRLPRSPGEWTEAVIPGP